MRAEWQLGTDGHDRRSSQGNSPSDVVNHPGVNLRPQPYSELAAPIGDLRSRPIGPAMSRGAGYPKSVEVSHRLGRSSMLGSMQSGTKYTEDMRAIQQYLVSASGQMSVPAAVRHRWHLDNGGPVDVIDLGFGVLTVPAGTAQLSFSGISSAARTTQHSSPPWPTTQISPPRESRRPRRSSSARRPRR